MARVDARGGEARQGELGGLRTWAPNATTAPPASRWGDEPGFMITAWYRSDDYVALLHLPPRADHPVLRAAGRPARSRPGAACGSPAGSTTSAWPPWRTRSRSSPARSRATNGARCSSTPRSATRMLAGSGAELLDTAAEIALTHHERYDGGGYPRGLAARGDPAPGRHHGRRRHVRRPHHRPRLPAGGHRRAGRRDPARRARAPTRPARGRRPAVDLLDEALAIRDRFAPPAAEEIPPRRRPRTAAHAAGRGDRARRLPQPAAPLVRRGPDHDGPHRRRPPPLPAGGRARARRRARRAPDRARGRAAHDPAHPARRAVPRPRRGRSPPPPPPRSTATARRAGSPPRPPPPNCARGSRSSSRAAPPGATSPRWRPPRR